MIVANISLAGVFNFTGNITKGSGKLASKTFEVSDFNAIEAGGTFKIKIK